MIGPQGENLIFVISPPRAGSTLLQRILAGNDDVFATAEPWIMLHPLYALRNAGHTAEYNAEWSNAALADFCENLEGGVDAYVRAAGTMGRELYNIALRPSGRRCFLDKTPRYYFIAEDLLRTFPEARFVFLLRHPLAVLSSVLSSWIHDDWARLSNYACDLCEAPRRLAAAIDHFGSRAIVLHYEELAQQPEKTVRDLCDKLGLAFHPGMLEYGLREKPKGRMGDNIGIDRHTHPVAESCDKWKTAITSDRARYFAGRYVEFLDEQVLARLGYPKDQLRGQLRELEPTVGSVPAEWEEHAREFFGAAPTPIAAPPTTSNASEANELLRSLRSWAEQWPETKRKSPPPTASEAALSGGAIGCLKQALACIDRGDVRFARDYIERAFDLAPKHSELRALFERIPADVSDQPAARAA